MFQHKIERQKTFQNHLNFLLCSASDTFFSPLNFPANIGHKTENN